MAGTRGYFVYDSDDDSTAVHTPSALDTLAMSDRQSGLAPGGSAFMSPQITPRSSLELAREGLPPPTIPLPEQPQVVLTPAPAVAATVPPRPRPVLRSRHTSPEGREFAERLERNKGVRFGTNEKGDGKRLTPEREASPSRNANSPTSREKPIYEQDTDEEDVDAEHVKEAHRLVRAFTHRQQLAAEIDLESGQTTPKHEPKEGLLSLLLKLQPHRNDAISGASTPGSAVSSPSTSAPASGSSTPRHFFASNRTHSANSISALLTTSSKLAIQSTGKKPDDEFNRQLNERLTAYAKEEKKRKKENRHSGTLQQFKKLAAKREKKHEKVKTLIAETIDKQHYLVKLCRLLIRYGAPTHRLEAYMRTSAYSLGIGGQFLYIPGCMIISFDDESTHTTEVKLVREDQGVDLGRMDSVHNIYKQVANGNLLVREGHLQLDALAGRDRKYPRWLLVLMYGLAAASVGPFAFQARVIDLPIAFLLGCIVGLLQYYVNAQSELWASCFTIFAPLITSALARVFGSIRGGDLFCFSALAQSSIALILPGYTVLCASLELQSGAIVAGSIRLVYALIYSLFLGFGITIGTVIVGAIWHDAVSSTHCNNPLSDDGYLFFLSVPIFTLCLSIINQAKWKQVPVQMFISLASYQVSYWVSQHVKGQALSNAAGALAVGLLANSYARFGYRHEVKLIRWCRKRVKPHVMRLIPNYLLPKSQQQADPVLYASEAGNPSEISLTSTLKNSVSHRATYGLAAAVMLPAIWVQVPSGLAVSGSLVSGITSADQITGNMTGSSVQSSATSDDPTKDNSAVLTVAISVVQIAVAITVGLFISTVLVYPRGKKRGGVFTM